MRAPDRGTEINAREKKRRQAQKTRGPRSERPNTVRLPPGKQPAKPCARDVMPGEDRDPAYSVAARTGAENSNWNCRGAA